MNRRYSGWQIILIVIVWLIVGFYQCTTTNTQKDYNEKTERY